jgi:hypothetical protein
MDVELREALTQGFGPEPAHRPVTDRLDAGHRAVRRRRIAGAVVTVAVASVVGLGAVAVLGGDGDAGSQVATDPTPTPDASTDEHPDPTPPPGWDEGEFARYDADGNLEIRPGVTMLDRIDSPFPPSAGMDQSVALAVEQEGQAFWLLMTWNTDEDGNTSESGTAWGPSSAEESFEEWVAEQVRLQTTPTPEDLSAGYVKFGDDGRLVSSHGVEILDQVLDPGFQDFVMQGEPSAAALLQGPDGKKWYVAVRDSGGLDVISVPFKTGGPDLDAFVDYARERYASGEGLR